VSEALKAMKRDGSYERLRLQGQKQSNNGK
jgi:hypothetical protein